MNPKSRTGGGTGRRRIVALAFALSALVALPALALAHIERASYWPAPAPDTSVTPPACAPLPAVRGAYAALDPTRLGDPRVDCPPDSMKRLSASLASAQAHGYQVRPSQPGIKVSKTDLQKLRSFNQQLFSACPYNSIQAGVTASGNNDRI